MSDLIEIQDKDDKDMPAFQFCLKALDPNGDKSMRPSWASRALIDDDGKTLVSSDGRRLHIAKLINGYVPGLYRVFKYQKTHVVLLREDEKKELNYPDYTKLFETDCKQEIEVHTSEDMGECVEALAYIIRRLPANLMINPEYLVDLGNRSWGVAIDEGQGVVLFYSLVANGVFRSAIMARKEV